MMSFSPTVLVGGYPCSVGLRNGKYRKSVGSAHIVRTVGTPKPVRDVVAAPPQRPILAHYHSHAGTTAARLLEMVPFIVLLGPVA